MAGAGDAPRVQAGPPQVLAEEPLRLRPGDLPPRVRPPGEAPPVQPRRQDHGAGGPPARLLPGPRQV